MSWLIWYRMGSFAKYLLQISYQRTYKVKTEEVLILKGLKLFFESYVLREFVGVGYSLEWKASFCQTGTKSIINDTWTYRDNIVPLIHIITHLYSSDLSDKPAI